MKDQTAIVGIGQTDVAKSLDGTELQLACVAIKAALEDAGIDPGEVDALSSFTQETTPEFEIARNLGMGELKFFSQVAHGGGAVCGAIGQVSMAISVGLAKVGVVWRSRKRGDPSTRQWAGVPPRIDDHWKWSRPHGLLRPVDEVAVMMRRYMHEYAVSREQLAAVALAQRDYANSNPAAIMRDKRLTRDTYLESRMISDPLCLYDNCLESDGAIAFVVTSAERARDLRQPPAFIHAFSQGMTRQHQLMTDYHGAEPLRSSSAATASNLWRQSDIAAGDIDIAQLYDAFSPLVLFSLENYGLCPRGEAAAFVASGATGRGGALPVNTSGGLVSKGHPVGATGLSMLAELASQLRGEAGPRQVQGAKIALAENGGGVIGMEEAVASVVILQRS